MNFLNALSKLKFPALIVILTILTFSFLYFYLCSVPENGIGPNQSNIEYLDCLYFSVVTISSLGYGDLQPLGFSRVVAGVEVLLGLIFIGVFVSKVVSIKQEETLKYVNISNITKRVTEANRLAFSARDGLIDLRDRANINARSIKSEYFLFRKMNPFYEPYLAITSMKSYVQHLENSEYLKDVDGRLEVTVHAVLDVSSAVRKLTATLSKKKIKWNTKLTRFYLYNINQCSIDLYECLLPYTKYYECTDQGGQSLESTIRKNIKNIEQEMSIKHA